ncbi:MAG: hypothetical protein ABL970_08915 [Nitrospira sp.]
MSVMHHKLDSWVKYQAVQDYEAERQAILQQPIMKNPDHLTKPVRVRRIGDPRRGFSVHGRAIQLYEVVTVEASVAAGLCQMGKAEMVTEG